MTQVEALWVAVDPLYPLYSAAFEDARAQSASTSGYHLVRRVYPLHSAAPAEFDIVPYTCWPDIYTAFRAGEEFLAIAHAGRIIACKK